MTAPAEMGPIYDSVVADTLIDPDKLYAALDAEFAELRQAVPATQTPATTAEEPATTEIEVVVQEPATTEIPVVAATPPPATT